MVITEQLIEKAIDAYIKDNFIAHRCSLCRTSTDVGFDKLGGESYCTPCMRESLRKDEESLVDYVEGYNVED